MNTQVDVPEVLSNTTIFRGMDQHQMERIGSICVERYVTAGDEIFPQGSASDELYVVANGEVDILLDRSMSSELEDAGHVTIATIRRGEAFGEIALVDQGVRSATARCGLSDTCVLVIRRADLIELCEAEPILGYQLMRNLAADLALTIRTRTTDMQLREWLTWARGQIT